MLFFRALREFVFAPASSPSLVLDGYAKPLLCLAGLVGSCAIQIRVVQPPQAVAQSWFFPLLSRLRRGCGDGWAQSPAPGGLGDFLYVLDRASANREPIHA
jgi:hypothetical protein